MKVTVIGSGYVGLVTGACLGEFGNEVVFLDIDPRKVDMLNRGSIPIHEPGLKPLIERNQAAGRIRFTTDAKAAIQHGDFLFIAVGTPPGEDGSADLQHVLAVARDIGCYLQDFKVVVNKSTVPVGTVDKVREVIVNGLIERDIARPEAMFSVVSNPEFLKEGAAIEDFMRPDRIVVGVANDACGARAHSLLKGLYAPFTRNHERYLEMDVRSAEFTKYAANAMLATRISFMNELANLADRIGVDIELVRQGIGADPRIGFSFLYAGIGYGGSCFPKDIHALLHTAQEADQPLRILQAVKQVNDAQKTVLLSKITKEMGADLTGKVMGFWGLSFKPNTDDMREAPSIKLMSELLRRGACIHAYDPVAMDEAARVLNGTMESAAFRNITFYSDPMTALDQCDALVIATEWKMFQSPAFDNMRKRMKQPLIFDGRNMYDPQQLRNIGFRYFTIGRDWAQP